MPTKILNKLKNTRTTYYLILNTKTGFTLVEILIAISISALAGIIALPGLRTYADRQQLNNAFNQLQTAVNLAHSNSQNKTICTDSEHPGASTTDWQLFFLSTNQFVVRGVCPTPIAQTTYSLTDVTYTTTSTGLGSGPCNTSIVNFNNSTGQVDLYCGPTLLDPTSNLQFVVKLNSNPSTTRTIIINHGGTPSEQ